MSLLNKAFVKQVRGGDEFWWWPRYPREGLMSVLAFKAGSKWSKFVKRTIWIARFRFRKDADIVLSFANHQRIEDAIERVLQDEARHSC